MTDPTQAGIPRLHPLPEVAEQTGIPLRTLREQARARRFDHVRIGRERYLTHAQLAALIETTTVTTDRSDALAKTRERQRRRRRKPTGQRPAA
ncbi:helix-turn-helix domain-containing protein [Micromonosporaceae bacterium B7E4]